MPRTALVSFFLTTLLLCQINNSVAEVTLNVPANTAIRFVTLEDFKPFAWCENGRPKGIDVEIVKRLMTEIEHPYKIECVPWKRALSSIRSGKADALFSAYKTKERETFATYMNAPTHLSTFSVFVRKGETFKFNRLEDLFGKRVGITAGYSVNAAFDTARQKQLISVHELPNAESGLRMLTRGRLDAYVNGQHVGLFTAQNLGISHLVEPLKTPLHNPKPAYLLFSKSAVFPNKEDVIKNLNRSLDKLWSTGEIERLTEQFILSGETAQK